MTLGIVLLTICDEQVIALVGSLAVRDDASVRLGDGWGYASTDYPLVTRGAPFPPVGRRHQGGIRYDDVSQR